jgi:GAF domain-containing protein
MQLVVNLTYGVPIGIGLYLIGVPNAVLWGLLAAVLRFVPYLGPFLAALFPLALAFAVDPGWSMLLWVAGLFLVAELISNNVVEPWLYGSSTGLSSLAIIMAAIFWTTLWGPVGLFLATPLTVCLVVIGRYVPQLEFLGVLLGSDPVLAPEERLYQRLLAGNLEEAVEMAETYVDEQSSRAFYDHVAMPALRLAEKTGSAAPRTQLPPPGRLHRNLRGAGDRGPRPGEGRAGREEGGRPDARRGSPGPVLCVAGRTELDRSAAEMLAQSLAHRGIGARVMSPIAVSQDTLGQLDLDGIEAVCLSYLHPQPQVFARYVCRRLKRRAPNLKLVVCLWNPPPQGSHARELTTQMSADAVVVTLAAALQQVDAWVAQPLKAPMQAPPTPENEQERLQALRELGVGTARGGYFDETTRRVAEAFDAPIALVSFIEEGPPALGRRHGPAPGPRRAQADVPGGLGLRARGGGGRGARHRGRHRGPTLRREPAAPGEGIRFYAGAPLRTAAGLILGSLCVIDTKPRTFSEEDRGKLQTMADALMARVEAGAPGGGETVG